MALSVGVDGLRFNDRMRVGALIRPILVHRVYSAQRILAHRPHYK